jgi:hypothetical protein
MTKEKTALTQLIEGLRECVRQCKETCDNTDPDLYPFTFASSEAMGFAYQRALEIATEHLPIEKQQIVDAYKDGFKDSQRPFIPNESLTTFDQYFQNKFEK